MSYLGITQFAFSIQSMSLELNGSMTFYDYEFCKLFYKPLQYLQDYF